MLFSQSVACENLAWGCMGVIYFLIALQSFDLKNVLIHNYR